MQGKKLLGLSLFSGIGGIDVALSEYVKPVAYCEIDPFCQSVLLSRMQEGDLPKAPIWDDINTFRDAIFDSGLIYQDIGIIYGGFPCQDISVAGTGKGLEGERSGLFFEIMRLAEEIKPKFIFLENVPAITRRGGLRVVREITSLGYDCRWCIISAQSVGALHRRERWFLLAYSKGNGLEGFGRGSIGSRWKARRDNKSEYWPFESRDDWQKTVNEVGKCIDGVSAGLVHNTEALKALGNAVVPQQTTKAFKILMIAEKGNKNGA